MVVVPALDVSKNLSTPFAFSVGTSESESTSDWVACETSNLLRTVHTSILGTEDVVKQH